MLKFLLVLSIACGFPALTHGGTSKAPVSGAPMTQSLPQTHGSPTLARVVVWDALGDKLPNVVALVPWWQVRSVHDQPFPVAIPQPLQPLITLRRLDGWLAVPRGWILYHSRSSGQGGADSLAVTAPGGETQGWMIALRDVDYDGGASFAGNALFPDAHAVLSRMAHPRHPVPPPALVQPQPRPSSIVRPSPCTVLMTYPAGGLVVKAAAVFSPYLQQGIDGPARYVATLSEIFLALPRNEAVLQDFIVGAFLAQHDQQHGACSL
ncbi:MAG: hypothetical protein ACRETQ_12965 [Gammaproteobacteria bacterium]